MSDVYCPNCGIQTKNNTTEGTTGDRLFTCSCCGFSIRFYIISKPSKSLTEAEQVFQNTQLTHKQEFG